MQTLRLLEGKRIFLVEDDVVNIHVFSKTLTNQGATVYQDVLGYGIVQHIVESLPLDLILLDVFLKRGQNGFDIFEKIKTNHNLAHIPTVAITSLDPETAIPKSREIGLSGFISKPINFSELPQQLVRILQGEKIWIVSR